MKEYEYDSFFSVPYKGAHVEELRSDFVYLNADRVGVGQVLLCVVLSAQVFKLIHCIECT